MLHALERDGRTRERSPVASDDIPTLAVSNLTRVLLRPRLGALGSARCVGVVALVVLRRRVGDGVDRRRLCPHTATRPARSAGNGVLDLLLSEAATRRVHIQESIGAMPSKTPRQSLSVPWDDGVNSVLGEVLDPDLSSGRQNLVRQADRARDDHAVPVTPVTSLQSQQEVIPRLERHVGDGTVSEPASSRYATLPHEQSSRPSLRWCQLRHRRPRLRRPERRGR